MTELKEIIKKPRAKNLDGTPNLIDKHVGSRIRARRTMLKLSQVDLASQLGVSFQQIQKYEIGSNRVSASRLWDIARSLSVDVGFLFEDLNSEAMMNSPKSFSSAAPTDFVASIADPMHRGETLELIKSFNSLRPDHSKYVLSLIKEMTKSGVPQEEDK